MSADVEARRAQMEAEDARLAGGYAFTPAGLARSAAAGGPGAAVPDDYEERAAASRRFWQAHGWEDPQGNLTPAGRAMLGRQEQHLANVNASNWLRLSEAEEREFVRRMRAGSLARDLAATGRGISPIEHATDRAAAAARIAEANANPAGALSRTVAGAS